jgi:hypothetical protein
MKMTFFLHLGKWVNFLEDCLILLHSYSKKLLSAIILIERVVGVFL